MGVCTSKAGSEVGMAGKLPGGKEMIDANGQEGVDVMIGKIEMQKREFDELKTAIKANGGTPPPYSDLAVVAAEEGCDAVGSLFNIEKSLQHQLEELVIRGGAAGATSFAADLEAIRKDLAGTHATLQSAVDSFLKEWKLNLTDLPPLPTDPKAFAELPIANKPGQVTMQRVIGALVLHAESKRDPAGPVDGEGRRRHGVWDHGVIDKAEAKAQAVARLGKAGFEDGNFLVWQLKGMPGEFILSVVKGDVTHHPIDTVSRTHASVLTVNGKSYGTPPASSLPELIEVLRNGPEGWSYGSLVRVYPTSISLT